MHKFVFSFIGLLVIAGLVALLGMQRAEREEQDRLAELHRNLDALEHVTQEHADLRNARAYGPRPTYPYPDAPDARWFRAGLPTNIYTPGQPWVDMAPPGDLGTHPPDPVIYRPDQPGLWFNPNLGVYRARVRPTRGRTNIDAYNTLNRVALDRLPTDTDPARATVALHRGADPLVPWVEDEPKTLTAEELAEPGPVLETEDGPVKIRIRSRIRVRDRGGNLVDLDPNKL